MHQKFSFFIIFLIISVDQYVKWLMLDVLHVAMHPIDVLPVLRFILVWNPGISFGLFSDVENGRIFLTVISLVISVILLIMLRKSEHILSSIGLVMIIGGAIGNVIDRIRYGAVVDYVSVYYHPFYFPVFNIADASVFLGVVCYLIFSMFYDTSHKERQLREDDKEHDA